jgi:ribosomal protein S18 acetylase RimI-like enzyme
MISVLDIRGRLNSDEVRHLVNQLEYPPEIRQAKTAQILKEYHDHPGQPILGVESNGELAGLIGLRLQPPDAAIIRHIVVRRELRGQGLGRQMIVHACAVYRLGAVFAETDHGAVEFYRKIGFAVESLGEKYPSTERFSCELKGAVQLPPAGGFER